MRGWGWDRSGDDLTRRREGIEEGGGLEAGILLNGDVVVTGIIRFGAMKGGERLYK